VTCPNKKQDGTLSKTLREKRKGRCEPSTFASISKVNDLSHRSRTRTHIPLDGYLLRGQQGKMGEPKEDEDSKKKEKKDKEERKGPHLDFLQVDRSLRPEGFHFEAEMNRRAQA